MIKSIKRTIFRELSKSIIPESLRIAIYRKLGVSLGEHCHILHGVRMNSHNIIIGSGCYLNFDCMLMVGETSEQIILGKNVQLGPRCIVTTDTHRIGDEFQRAGKRKYKGVSIGDGCWLGANVIVLPGVHIAEGCVIGAGAVVTQNTDSNGLYVGVPARRIRNL